MAAVNWSDALTRPMITMLKVMGGRDSAYRLASLPLKVEDTWVGLVVPSTTEAL